MKAQENWTRILAGTALGVYLLGWLGAGIYLWVSGELKTQFVLWLGAFAIPTTAMIAVTGGKSVMHAIANGMNGKAKP